MDSAVLPRGFSRLTKKTRTRRMQSKSGSKNGDVGEYLIRTNQRRNNIVSYYLVFDKFWVHISGQKTGWREWEFPLFS